MRIVVNRLVFSEPIGERVVDAVRSAGPLVRDAGALSIRFARVDDTHGFLVLEFPDLETEERVTREVGGPFMREHILPLLAGPTDRVSGEVFA